MGENPPSYNVVTVNLPPEAEAAAANLQPGASFKMLTYGKSNILE
jgi:hypothetical protein